MVYGFLSPQIIVRMYDSIAIGILATTYLNMVLPFIT